MSPNRTKPTPTPSIHSINSDHHQPPFTLQDSNLMLNNNHLILSDVPSNITLTTPSPSMKATNMTSGCFLGFNSKDLKCRHVVPLGKLKGIRFMSIFCFKVWWSTHWVGNKGSDVEHETQFMLLDKSHLGRPYVLLLPLIEGPFRASLQPGNHDENIDICVESGSNQVIGSSFRSVMYMHVGDDPYKLIKEAMKVVRVHLGTFKLLEEKTPPSIVDKFGWCTWDSFYLEVHPQGVWEGVKDLVEGGCPPGFVIIDDGWKSMCHDDDDPMTEQQSMNRTTAGEQIPCRITNFRENYLFRNYQSKVSLKDKGMGALVKDLKGAFKSLEYVYVWHALCGFWGGIRPNVEGMPESRIVDAKLSESQLMCMDDGAVNGILKGGVALVPPELVHQLYNGLHSYLKAVGIDGVKVDVIHVLEMLSEDYGGRVELAKAYYNALTESVRKHFNGNGVLASMQQSNDFMFLGTQAISLGRVGDDFWSPETSGDPEGAFWLQGCHMVHCAYNSLWMGNFIHPDWDMFMSLHPCAKFHAASRAISGGPIYVSDPVGNHDFQLLKSLVLPDGTILRCEYYALPTRDCLFQDPLHDGKTMLKIWNLNKYVGVVGAFNCQGGGWCRKARKNKCTVEFSHTISSMINVGDIEWKNGNHFIPMDGVETFAVYMFNKRKLVLLKSTENREILLEPFSFELFTICPVKNLSKGLIQFGAIGLVNMLNSGGAVQSMCLGAEENLVRIGVKGRGEMRVFASVMPKVCRIDGKEVPFGYDEQMVMIEIPWPGCSKLSIIDYVF